MTKPRKLLTELSRDPQLRRAMVKARGNRRGKGVARVETAGSVVLFLLGIASRFAKKKKARAIEEARDLIYLLVQVSIVLKENVFDRPEVKKFFSRGLRQIYSAAREVVAVVLPAPKGARPSRALIAIGRKGRKS